MALIATVLVVRLSYVLTTGASAQFVRSFTHFRIDALLSGVLLASIYRFRPDTWAALAGKRRLLTAMCAIGLATFAFNPNHSVYVGAVGYTTVQLLFCAIIIIASQSDASRFLAPVQRTLAGLAWIGRHSYPIYLLHPFLWVAEGALIVPWVAESNFMERSVIWLVGYIVFVVASVALGASVGELVEKPLLTLRNRLYPPRTVALENGRDHATAGQGGLPVGLTDPASSLNLQSPESIKAA